MLKSIPKFDMNSLISVFLELSVTFLAALQAMFFDRQLCALWQRLIRLYVLKPSDLSIDRLRRLLYRGTYRCQSRALGKRIWLLTIQIVRWPGSLSPAWYRRAPAIRVSFHSTWQFGYVGNGRRWNEEPTGILDAGN
jgi:hypothetical protein